MRVQVCVACTGFGEELALMTSRSLRMSPRRFKRNTHKLTFDLLNSLDEIAWRDSLDFVYNSLGPNTRLYDNHFDQRKDAFDLAQPDGLVLEFGVFKGKSLGYFSQLLTDRGDQRTIFGFDSGSGFSEDWTGVERVYSRAHFAVSRSEISVPKNAELIHGFIEETLPEFLAKYTCSRASFVHIDTDTYSPANTVLSLLKPLLFPGSIVLFDELCGYPNWRNHEFRALRENLPVEDYEFISFGVAGPSARLVKACIRIR